MMQICRGIACIYYILLCYYFVIYDNSVSSKIIPSVHKSNHAVLLSASKYWFNYRHNSNALLIYKLLKDNGFQDENIILMLADDFITNARNPVKNGIYSKPGYLSTVGNTSTYVNNDSILDTLDTKIDYRGEDVTVQNFVNVLIGRQNSGLPVLKSDENSNVLIYLTGHGGDQFFKFLDIEEILAEQLAATLRQMYTEGKYHEMLIIADTCQAFTLGDKIDKTIPNVTIIGSSLKGQSSYAHHSDPYLGLSIIEKYTHHLVEHINAKDPKLEKSIKEIMIDPFSFQQQRADIGVSDVTSIRKIHEIPLKDFFSNVQNNKNDRSKLNHIQANEFRFVQEQEFFNVFLEKAINEESINSPRDEVLSMNQIDIETIKTYARLEPSDPLFVFLVVGVFVSVIVLGRKW